MNECSIEVTNTCLNLSDQTKFRLNEINKIILTHFNYIAAFDYFEKTLIVLSATSRGISIISFASIIGAPVGITSASFSLTFYLITGIIKKLLKITKKNLCWLKSN